MEENARRGKPEKPRVEFLSTGSTLLNLAASGKGRDGGWARGRIINIVGDGSTGKTLLALEACAHAFYQFPDKSLIYPKVKSLSIVYDNVEEVMDFPLEEMYGEEFVEGVEWIHSETCQEFGQGYIKRVKGLKKGQALLYVIDSIDAAIPKEAKERIEKETEGERGKGSYGVEKAKYFSSQFFNYLVSEMKGKDATLICISQVREKLDAPKFGKKHYRTGGKALDFYTHQVAWLYQVEKMKVERNKKKIVYGVRTRCVLERNKTAKPYREAVIPILFDHGVDDIGGMADYLFGPKEKRVEFAGYEWKTKADLISDVEEDEGLYNQLVEAVEEDWAALEEAARTKRKPKYRREG